MPTTHPTTPVRPTTVTTNGPDVLPTSDVLDPDEVAIDDVYARLERASRNHLRAFVGQLEMLGVDDEPTLLADFAAIVSSPIERGRDDH